MRIWQSPSGKLIDAPKDLPALDANEEMKTEAVVDDRVVLIHHQNAFISMDQVKCLAFKKTI